MAERLAVLFYADLATSFAPSDLNKRPIGGSETALVYVARALAAIGHTVVVAAHPRNSAGIYEGVRYVNVESAEWRSADPDVTVVFRQLPHVRRVLPGRHRMLWAHDHIGIYPELAGARRIVLGASWSLGYRLFGRYAPTIVTVSNWLRDCFTQFARWPEDDINVIPNGIDPALFAPSPPAPLGFRASSPSPTRGKGEAGEGVGEGERPPRLANTSRPERGLKLLLQKIMPAVWHKIPSVELHIFSYAPLDEYRRLAPAGSDRVRFRGGLEKSALARELATCDLWVYPTNFPETSCIAAMEAQAAGVPVISSRRYALPETVRHSETGVLIDGEVGSDGYVGQFADAVVDLLRNDDRRLAMGRRARERMLSEFTWDQVVNEWNQLLTLLASKG